MSLQDFERRMLRLKGVKLPAQGIIDTKYNSYGRKAIITANSNVGKILADIHEEYVVDEALDDIITGVIRSFDVANTHKGLKLNAAVVRSMLHKLPTISQLSIMDNFGYGRQQASKYAQACRLVIQFNARSNLKQSFIILAKFSGE